MIGQWDDIAVPSGREGREAEIDQPEERARLREIELAGAGYALPMSTIAPLAVGVLLMVLGNYMGKLRRNFFMGIRTPWTLASEAVWERTHRMAGWLFVLGGAVMVVAALAGAVRGRLLLAVIVVVALVPVVYSYFVYRRLEGRHPSEGKAP